MFRRENNLSRNGQSGLMNAFYYYVISSFRLIEWIFHNINREETSDEAKAVFLKGLHELLSSEGGKSPHAPMLPVSEGKEY